MAEWDMTPNLIVQNLIRLNGDLRELTGKLKDRERNGAESRVAYAVAYAKAYMTAEGTIEARKYQAVLATETELRNKEYAEAELNCQKADIAALRVSIDSARSSGALLRAEMNL